MYASAILRERWTPAQAEIAEALVKHRRVMVSASHSVGKTHLGGGLVNWFFDCFPQSITLTTAPTAAQVEDLLWKEVRTQRKGRKGLAPKAPRMERSADWFAVGYTATGSTSFQGRHAERMFVLIDEAVGVDSEIWDAVSGMLTTDESYALAIFNPTDTSSRAYEEYTSGRWHTIRLSAMDHPNIAAELAGDPAPWPAAVRLGWIDERVHEWCERIPPEDARAGDFEWRPGSGNWYRPGPLFESRVLGLWPSQSAYSIWSEHDWQAAVTARLEPSGPVEIGCDVARFGDDYTSIVVRQGQCALHHETHNGWDGPQIVARLKALCERFAPEEPKGVTVKVDDLGGTVCDWAKLDGWRFTDVNSAERAFEPDAYPNRRSELWFSTAAMAHEMRLDLSRLSKESLNELRRQAFAPVWKPDSQGRRVAEPKDQTKKRLKRSPDDMDALNLAFSAPARLWKWDVW